MSADTPLSSDSLLPVKCPHCEESFSVGMTATIPAEQKLTMTLEHTRHTEAGGGPQR